MKTSFSQRYSLIIMTSLLGLPLFLSAALSEGEIRHVSNHEEENFLYCDKEMADVIEEISKLDNDRNSPAWQLLNHIKRGYTIGEENAVREALEYAEELINNRPNNERTAQTRKQLISVIQAVEAGNLDVNVDVYTAEQLREAAQNEDDSFRDTQIIHLRQKLYAMERAKFFEEVEFKDHVEFEHFVRFEGNVKFDKNVTIEGTLSVTDLVVLSCMDTLCVNDLSVVDETVSGTLTAADAFIECDLTVGCNISMNDSLSPAIGNIVKNGTIYIQNFGLNNNFMGKNAGNFALTGSGNVGLGDSALASLTSGTDNVAVGVSALTSDASGSQNVAIGRNTLLLNTVDNLTAVGWKALQSNTTGTENTAVGSSALSSNSTGIQNTAVGIAALGANTIGQGNTGIGRAALNLNSTGNFNTALGFRALQLSGTGISDNTAAGAEALLNTTGDRNTGIGRAALKANGAGADNTALGFNTLASVSTGSNNIAIGSGAGATLTTGSGNIYINANAAASGEAATIRIGTAETRTFIAGIRGVTTGIANAIAVLIDSAGQLGTVSSTRRVKHNIKDMGNDSAAIYKLRPVTFAYNGDTSETKQYGLIAEEASEVFPEIVVVDENGQPFTVQYHVLPALLLNEVKKLAARVAALEARRN